MIPSAVVLISSHGFFTWATTTLSPHFVPVAFPDVITISVPLRFLPFQCSPLYQWPPVSRIFLFLYMYVSCRSRVSNDPPFGFDDTVIATKSLISTALRKWGQPRLNDDGGLPNGKSAVVPENLTSFALIGAC